MHISFVIHCSPEDILAELLHAGVHRVKLNITALIDYALTVAEITLSSILGHGFVGATGNMHSTERCAYLSTGRGSGPGNEQENARCFAE